MTAMRLIPLPIHSALELVTGLVLMTLPFALGLGAAAMVSGAVLGALIAGHALQPLDTPGRPPVPVSAHYAADLGLALGLGGAALILAAEDSTAAILFGAAAATQLVLNLATRYSQR